MVLPIQSPELELSSQYLRQVSLLHAATPEHTGHEVWDQALQEKEMHPAPCSENSLFLGQGLWVWRWGRWLWKVWFLSPWDLGCQGYGLSGQPTKWADAVEHCIGGGMEGNKLTLLVGSRSSELGRDAAEWQMP